MRRQDAGLWATIAFMFFVCAITLGLSVIKASEAGHELRMAFDETIENAR